MIRRSQCREFNSYQARISTRAYIECAEQATLLPGQCTGGQDAIHAHHLFCAPPARRLFDEQSIEVSFLLEQLYVWLPNVCTWARMLPCWAARICGLRFESKQISRWCSQSTNADPAVVWRRRPASFGSSSEAPANLLPDSLPRPWGQHPRGHCPLMLASCERTAGFA
jgi:hypothetical protein